MEFKNRVFTDSVELDGNTYDSCTFKNVEMVYGGGQLPQFVSCTMEGCTVRFVAAAARTIAWLKMLTGSPIGGVSKGVAEDILAGVTPPQNNETTPIE